MTKPNDSIIDQFQSLTQMGRITPETYASIVPIVNYEVDAWTKEKIDSIQALIADWETKMGETDKTLYTLGLRRALDILRDEEFDPSERVLETDSTPDSIEEIDPSKLED